MYMNKIPIQYKLKKSQCNLKIINYLLFCCCFFFVSIISLLLIVIKIEWVYDQIIVILEKLISNGTVVYLSHKLSLVSVWLLISYFFI